MRSPLALDAGVGGDPAVPPAHQLAKAIDLLLLVDVDLEVEAGAVTPVGPEEGAGPIEEGRGGSHGGQTAIGEAAGETVEGAGEEKRGGDEGERADLVDPSARHL